MEGHTDPLDIRPYLTIAEIARGIAMLPAVATHDWCDKAAEAVASLLSPSQAIVVIGDVEPGGHFGTIEAIGVADVGNLPPASRGSSLELLRARAYRLPHAGLRPDASTRPEAASTTASALSATWRTGPVGQLWSGVDATDVLIGSIPLSARFPARRLGVHIAPTSAAEITRDHLAMLGALLPLLGGKAVQAIGADKAHARAWLTPREQEILEQLTLGKSVKQIADALGRSPHTVHDHVKALHKKLGANTRGELIARVLGHLDPASFLDVPTGPREAVVTPVARIDSLPARSAG